MTKKKQTTKQKAKQEAKPKTAEVTNTETNTETNVTAAKYTITIQLGENVVSGTGETILEALEGIKKPVKITTKMFINVTDGTRKAELMFMPAHAKRLFYPIAQLYFAEKFKVLLK